MTAGVGFDKYWDDGGAVTPDEAAKSLIKWAEKLDMSKSGEYWAPRGPRKLFSVPRLWSDMLNDVYRGYWDSRSGIRERTTNTIAATLVDKPFFMHNSFETKKYVQLSELSNPA